MPQSIRLLESRTYVCIIAYFYFAHGALVDGMVLLLSFSRFAVPFNAHGATVDGCEKVCVGAIFGLESLDDFHDARNDPPKKIRK